MRGTTSLSAEHIPSNDSCELRLATLYRREASACARLQCLARASDGWGDIIADVTSEKEWARSSRRAFIRSHHPDRGGDPTTFRAGLRAWDDVLHEPRPRVVVVRAQPWPRMLLATLARPIRRRRRRTARVR